MTWAELVKSDRIRQGDVFSDVEYVESIRESDGKIEIRKIQFPLVVVLTQDCDLMFDYQSRQIPKSQNQNKQLISVIVAPMYNEMYVLDGSHLSELGMTMQSIRKDSTQHKAIRNNQNPRYHHLAVSDSISALQAQIIDFKHYFTINVSELEEARESNFVCKVRELHRESISHRFAFFLSRIGLPDLLTAMEKEDRTHTGYSVAKGG